ADRNWTAQLRPVRDRALSARFEKLGFAVHHLAGNVAEWLAKPTPTAKKSYVIGGMAEDNRLTPSEKQKYFSGEAPREEHLDVGRAGFGFRLVLRPQPYFADLLPVE